MAAAPIERVALPVLTPTSELPIIDFRRLAHRSMGSETLETELLALFAAEAERLLRQAESAFDAETRADRLRAVAAAARSVGALRLAGVAASLADPAGAQEPDLERLRSALAEAMTYIRIARA